MISQNHMKNISDQATNILKEPKKSKKGFIEIIVVIIVALVLINLLGIDLKSVLAQDSVRQFFQYTKDLCILLWNDLKIIIDVIRHSNTAPTSYPTVN